MKSTRQRPVKQLTQWWKSQRPIWSLPLCAAALLSIGLLAVSILQVRQLDWLRKLNAEFQHEVTMGVSQAALIRQLQTETMIARQAETALNQSAAKAAEQAQEAAMKLARLREEIQLAEQKKVEVLKGSDGSTVPAAGRGGQ